MRPTTCLALLAVLSTAARASEPNSVERKLRVVVFGGHPDDPESGAGGLIATLSRQGHDVILAYGTTFRSGRRFFDRPEADVRREEASTACRILGARPKFFPYAHETLRADDSTFKEVSTWLDEIKPDVVVTHWPIDAHPNHHVVASLVWQSYLQSRAWNLYHFEVMTDRQTLLFEPELYLDLAPVLETKKRALDEHKSQVPSEIWKSHEEMHARRGRECGIARAEGYRLVEARPGKPLLPVEFLRGVR